MNISDYHSPTGVEEEVELQTVSSSFWEVLQVEEEVVRGELLARATSSRFFLDSPSPTLMSRVDPLLPYRLALIIICLGWLIASIKPYQTLSY